MTFHIILALTPLLERLIVSRVFIKRVDDINRKICDCRSKNL